MKYTEFHTIFDKYCIGHNLMYDGPIKYEGQDGTTKIVYDLNDFSQYYKTIILMVASSNEIIGISLRGIKLREVANKLDGRFFNIPVTVIHKDYDSLFQQIILRADDFIK